MARPSDGSDFAQRSVMDKQHKQQQSRLVTIDGIPATVISPRIFKKSGKLGWYSQQPTVIDGKDATIQVLVYFNE